MTVTNVTVILPCTHLSEELVAALSSLQNQTISGQYLLSVPSFLADQAERILQRNSFQNLFQVCSVASSDSADLANAALRLAKGRLVAFMRTTDLLTPAYLEKTVDYCHRFNADFVLSDIRTFDQARTILQAPETVGELLAFPWFPLALTARSEALQQIQFSTGLTGLEMTDFAIRLITAGNRFVNLRDPLYLHRQATEEAPDFARSLTNYMEAHEKLYQENWKEVLLAKDQKIRSFADELAPKYEQLKQAHEKLEARFAELKKEHEALEEHHARSLSSIKVTGVHLIRAIFSRFSVTRS